MNYLKQIEQEAKKKCKAGNHVLINNIGHLQCVFCNKKIKKQEEVKYEY